MPLPSKADLLVIGAGSGGVRAARMAAAAGARVVVAESGPLGGTCVNLGCIPKKLFYYGSSFSHQFEAAPEYGWGSASPAFDWTGLVRAKDREITRLNGIYRQILQTPGAQIVAGRARLAGNQQVEIDGRRISADRILLATGSRAVRADFPGSELTVVSDDLFHMPKLPPRIAVLGGGYIAVEFAGIFAALGCSVDLLYRRAPLLRGMDMEVRQFVTGQIAGKGVKVHLNAQVQRLVKTSDGLKLHWRQGEAAQELQTDLVLSATGRKPNTADMGLEEAGVELDARGAVAVNDQWQTSAPGICAVGDLIGTPQLTPLAIAQAMNFHRRHYAAEEPQPVNYSLIPTAVFCQPQIGSVGMTEQQAMENCGDIRVYTSDFRPLHNVVSDREERMLTKLIVDAASDTVVGAHMVGEGASEIIQGLAVAVTHGLTKAEFDRTMAVHPTAAEEFVTMTSWRSGEAAAPEASL